MFFREIAYLPIRELPLIAYLGILTLLSFFFTASISIMNKRGINKIPFKWHPRVAIISLILGTIHGLLAVLASLGF